MRTVLLPVVLYGHETWFLALRKEQKEQGAENNIWTEEG
jgi:preprotein translocase subunit YajC